ncbi:MAG: M50 family metallopeptidase, partial [Pyrinomonadaceae bacterium]
MSNFLKFFKRRLSIARIYGVPIVIDYRWFIVLVLASWLTAVNLPFAGNQIIQLGLGLLTTLLFFFSILLHEVSHAWVARREGIGVVEIVLHPFGGMARMEKEPQTPKAEFRIAIAGPVMSILVSMTFLLLLAVARIFDNPILMSIFALLFFANFVLAIFNMFPGYPLDGGRVLRAILWRRGVSLTKATILTGKAGQIIGIALVASGIILLILRSDLTTAIWSGLVGIFLFDTANEIVAKYTDRQTTSIDKLMKPAFSVLPDMKISEFIEKILPMSKQTVFPVAKDRRFYGLLLLEDLKKMEKIMWAEKKAEDIMRPVQNNFFVKISASVDEAKRLMQDNRIGALGVIDEDGNLVGFLQSRDF